MNDELRGSLWNALHIVVWNSPSFLRSSFEIPYIFRFAEILWFNYFKEPIDRIPRHPDDVLESIRGYFFKAKWNEVYDFIEAVVDAGLEQRAKLISLTNHVLERELSAYRLIDGKVAPIADKLEREMLEIALADSQFKSVTSHLERALALLADRSNPDYRNSIKESISAVESMAKIVTGGSASTLGDAIKTLKSHGTIHSTLLTAFEKLYGYTNGQDGIRHAMMDLPNLNQDDARYFLLTCTSFVNYLKAAYGRQNSQ